MTNDANNGKGETSNENIFKLIFGKKNGRIRREYSLDFFIFMILVKLKGYEVVGDTLQLVARRSMAELC